MDGLANATAAIVREGEAAVAVGGIYDREYVEVNGFTGERPVFTCKDVDLPAIKTDTRVTLGGQLYRVAVVQPDGAGITTLVLEAQ